MSTKILTVMAVMLVGQPIWAAQYKCDVSERKSTGSHPTSGEKGSTVENACGSAFIDSEKVDQGTAFFDCGHGQGVSVHMRRSSSASMHKDDAANDATYAQLSILVRGTPEDWRARRPLSRTFLESAEGVPTEFVMNLGHDRGGIVREWSTSYYAVCSKVK